MKSILVSVLALVLAGPVVAQSQQYVSTDGALFTYEENRHGAVLTSIEPPAEGSLIVGQDDGGMKVEPGDILYLGRSCDAFSKEFGSGDWSWTNGGFIVDFGNMRVAFPGQAVTIVSGNRCRI